MRLTSSPSHFFHRRALTLVELLVVIVAIGVINSVAMMAFNGHYRDAAIQMQNRRNAQEIASEIQRASGAGVDVFKGGGLEDAILNLIDGVIAEDGPFRGRAFMVILPSKGGYHGAMGYLERRGEDVFYLPE